MSLSNRELVEAAKKTGPHGDDVAKSMQVLFTLSSLNLGAGAFNTFSVLI